MTLDSRQRFIVPTRDTSCRLMKTRLSWDLEQVAPKADVVTDRKPLAVTSGEGFFRYALISLSTNAFNANSNI